MKKRRGTGRKSRLLGIPVVLFALAGRLLLRVPLRDAAAVPAFFLLLAGVLLCTLLPALAGLTGLCRLREEDLTDGIPGAEMLYQDVLCGVLLFCPCTLLRDLFFSLSGREAAVRPMDPALFFPLFLLLVLLVPAAEGLYYRVFLERHFLPGKWAVPVSAALFAAAGGDAALFLPRLLLALLLSRCVRRHGSLLSGAVIHGSFMAALLFSGAFGIFRGDLGVAGAFLRLGGCFLWYRSLLRVWRLPAADRKLTPGMAASVRKWKLSRRQKGLLIALPVLAVLVPVITEVIR